jgi:predicted DNA-binding protein with PD1-like motif
MQYAQGSFGRVFLLKFDDQDDLLTGIGQVAIKEQVKAGTIMLLGGLRSGSIVTGPKEAVIPPEPVWQNFSDGREVLGIGTLYWHGDEPAIHLHGALGRGKETLTGCIRKDHSVYLVIEAVLTEIIGIDARRALDSSTGLVMLDLPNGRRL